MLDHEEVDHGDKMMNLQDNGRSYECMYCKHGFTTAQALGGHMNVHRKDRAKISRSINPNIPSKSNLLITHEFMSRSTTPMINDDHYINNHGKYDQNPNNGLIITSTATPLPEEMRLSLSLSLQFGRSHEDHQESVQEGINEEDNDEVLDLELRLGFDP